MCATFTLISKFNILESYQLDLNIITTRSTKYELFMPIYSVLGSIHLPSVAVYMKSRNKVEKR